MSRPEKITQESLVRAMQRHDLPIVAAMMAKLAHQRRDAEPMDVAILQSLIFDPAPRLLALVAERFGCTVGYGLARREGDALLIDQLVVMEGSRGLGLGRGLVDGMAALAGTLGCEIVLAAANAHADHGATFCDAVGLRIEELRMPA